MNFFNSNKEMQKLKKEKTINHEVILLVAITTIAVKENRCRRAPSQLSLTM